MNSYTDESGFDGVVPAHPIECEGTALPDAISAEPEEGSTTIKLKGKDAEAFVTRLEQPAQMKPELVKLFSAGPVAMVGTGYEEEVVSELWDISLERHRAGIWNEDGAISAILAKHSQQAVTEATMGLVKALKNARLYVEVVEKEFNSPTNHAEGTLKVIDAALAVAAQREASNG
ncbi:hypothetical protein [Rhizobium leguminosarum]|jgi:hypothetical protein|uniref:hypothetical protein n=1 Tax=Rhizobium leguminosarum TaxID=384 RepID=UPI0016081F13|nr:hypothetical protein [Rhizobium leguminosarum]MBB4345157.1 hypothetical protein [Rhizobium leguminosarum]MBB6298228.1 hypothetical protein [Rhizobium leguminosarum]